MWASYLMAALRRLARDRLHAGVTIFSLALGFTAAIVIGVYVRGEYRYDRFAGHERLYALVQVHSYQGKVTDGSLRNSQANADLIAGAVPGVEATTRLVRGDDAIVQRGAVGSVEKGFAWADPNFFNLFPFRVIHGDLATALSAPDGLVLTRALARKYFGRDDPVGQTVTVNLAAQDSTDPLERQPHPMTVTAVIDDLPFNTQFQATAFGSSLAAESPQSRGLPWNEVYLRLRPGVSARAIGQGVAEANRQQPPRSASAGVLELRLRPITDLHMAAAPDVPTNDFGESQIAHGNPGPLRVASALGGLILVIAAMNFASLMTARGGSRAVEIGVRKAAGARRADIFIQFIGEALLYALLALMVALAAAEVVLPALGAALAKTLNIDYFGDPALVLAMAAVAVATGVLAGLYPALVLSGFKPALMLKGGLVKTAGSARVRRGLVAAQFAVLICLVLVTVTVWSQSRFGVSQVMRWIGSNVVLFDDEDCGAGLIERITRVQGVIGAYCQKAPVADTHYAHIVEEQGGARVKIAEEIVPGGAMEFFGFKPLAGRLFGPAAKVLTPETSTPRPDLFGGPYYENRRLVVINEAARKALGYASPQAAIGRSFGPVSDLMGDPNVTAAQATIIGVVGDVSYRGPVTATYYYQSEQPMGGDVAVRLSDADLAASLRRLDAAWRAMGNIRPLDRRFYDDDVRALYKPVTDLARLTAAAAGLALFIACLGMFSLSAFSAQRRTKEIGIRKAMGARTGAVLWLLLGEFSQPVAVGCLIAWPAAYIGLSWWLRGFAYPAPLPAWIFLAAGAFALVVAWATTLAHALSVARARPVAALRYE